MNNPELQRQIRSAIQRGEDGKVRALIAEDEDNLNMMTPFGTWLHVAAYAGQLAIVKYLVSRGIDVNRRGGILGGGALSEAASNGHIEVVQYLLSCGAVMNTTDPRFNPLFSAIYGGHPDIARLLIEKGIDTKVRLFRAFHEGHGCPRFCARTRPKGDR